MSAIISMTTIPDRIWHIESCVRSLASQGLPVYLWAVEKIKRSKTRLECFPPFLADMGIHTEMVTDCGPITKLLPGLLAGFEVILTADDDCEYGNNWAADLLTWADKLPGTALGYRGRILTGKGYTNSKLVQRRIKEPVDVDILTGVHGALYQAAMFDTGIHDEWRCWPTNDDLVISAHLQRRGVPRMVVPSNCEIQNAKVQHIKPLMKVNRHQRDQRNDQGLALLGLESRK